MMLPLPLPEEEQSSAIVEELSSSVNFMNMDAPPSPPRVYHLVTGALLHSCSLVMHSPLPEASPPVSKPMETSASAGGSKGQLKGKQTKNKGKGKVTASNPPPTCTPSPPTTVTTSAA